MNIRVLPLAFVAATLLSACATQPVASSAAKRIPSNRIYDASLTTAAAGKTEVRFIRDVGFMGGGVKAVISLRGREIGALGTGEVFSVYLNPGIYTFSMLQRPNLFGYEVPREIEIDVKAGRTVKIRVGFSESGPVFTPITF